MSYRKERFLKFKVDGKTPVPGFLDDKSEEDLHALFLEVLQNAMHGICFSGYGIGEKPGDLINEELKTKKKSNPLLSLGKKVMWILLQLVTKCCTVATSMKKNFWNIFDGLKKPYPISLWAMWMRITNLHSVRHW